MKNKNRNKAIIVILIYFAFALIPADKICFWITNDYTKTILIKNFIVNIIMVLIIVISYKDSIVNKISTLKNTKKLDLFKNIIQDTLILIFLQIAGSMIGNIICNDNAISTNQILINDASKIHPVLMIILACILGPIIEEVIFRKYTYLILRKYNKTIYMIVSATIFATIHLISSFGSLNINQILSNFVVYFAEGVAFALIYEKRKNICNSMIVHSILNIISMILILCYL